VELLSIIIPVLNEGAIIEKTLLALQGNSDVEIIVVDGGSVDQTVTLANQIGVKVITVSGIGRAAQMNAGAAIAKGDILLFLHADTLLPPNYQEIVKKIIYQQNAIPQGHNIAGAFELAIDGKEQSLRLVETLVKMRSRWFSLPYGDQAIFLTKKVFEDLGGFPELPIMEDFEFVQRLKRRGKIAIAPVSVITSSRRWQKLGVFKTTLINQLIILGYYLGISPTKLKNFYRRSNHK
jgi:rSAM/selenodomain-associated transferase 2